MKRCRKGASECQCPLRDQADYFMHVILRCVETANWRVGAICEK
jgi:hypothetical protein